MKWQIAISREAIVNTSLILSGLLFAACAGPTIQQASTPIEPTFAEPPATSGQLAELAGDLRSEYGEDQSGFRLLDESQEALTWRLALIDSAVSSVDILTYLWYADNVGALILERAIEAARRGVRVRLVIDDLLTIGQDQLLANIQEQANVEVRLFNPWRNRNLGSRAGEMIAEMERLNSRMHDKLLIVDGNAAVVGGRNIGDHYFGLNSSYNFHDLDLLAVGPIVTDASDMFDHFWNSPLLVSAERLSASPDPESAEGAWVALQERTRTQPELEAFARKPKDWTAELEDLRNELVPGTGHLIYDELTPGGIDQSMIASMFSLFERAERELLITNAYIIPGKPGIKMLQGLTERGVDVRILTNSLASHDVPAVNSHYEPWRKRLIDAGANLYELRADPEIQSIVDVPPVSSEFSGLHTKAAVIDGRLVFVGSMNLDPRSAAINTEMGAVIDSPELASELRRIMLRDMSGENAWHVTLTDNNRLQWSNSETTRDSQPTRGFMQNVMNVIMKVVPKEQF